MSGVLCGKLKSGGFGRLDLIAVLAVLFGLAVFMSAIEFHLRNPATHIRCALNLKELGVAMAIYEKDNDERLPYAFIKPEKDSDRNSKVWDGLIFPLIPLNSAGLAQKHLFRCPADTIPRTGDRSQRTYAMPAHDMTAEDWPPGPDNDTGVGLFWEAGKPGLADITNLTHDANSLEANGNARSTYAIPAFRLSIIPAPASTLLLTENARPANILFSPSGATIRGPSQHVQTRLVDIENYHGARVNYLLIDGHVEFLNPQDSVGRGDSESGNSRKGYPDIWTVRRDD